MWAIALCAFVAGLTTWPAVTGDTPLKRDKSSEAQTQAVAANAQAVKDSGEAVAYWHDIALTATKQLGDLRDQVEAARDKQDTATLKVVSGAQYFNAATLAALRRIPADKRCPETVLATLMATKTDAALTGLVGTMTPAQQKEIAELINELLSEDQKARDEAQAKLDAKEAEVRAAQSDRDKALGQVEGLHAAVEAQKVVAQKAQEGEAKAIGTLKEKTDTFMQALKQAASDIHFWKFGFLYMVIFTGVLLLVSGRLIPQLCTVYKWKWLEPLNRLNDFAFRLLAGRRAITESDYQILLKAKDMSPK